MSDLDLAAIKARCAAATPGPWRLSRSEGIICGDDMYLIDGGGIAPSDAEFIAAARTDVPDLVAEVERLRSELAECYRITGADPDGDDDAMLARKSVAAVRRLREESDHQGTRADEFAEEVKKIAKGRDEAFAVLADAAAALAAGDMERVRLDLCDRYARTRAFRLNAEREAELARLRALLAKGGAA